MIADGIENCLMYAHNFNPEKSTNPFSYFTQMIYYAFLRRIEKEKKQNYIKYKLMEQADDGSFVNWFKENYFEKESKNAYAEFFEVTDNDIEKFTPAKKKKKKNEDMPSEWYPLWGKRRLTTILRLLHEVFWWSVVPIP